MRRGIRGLAVWGSGGLALESRLRSAMTYEPRYPGRVLTADEVKQLEVETRRAALSRRDGETRTRS